MKSRRIITLTSDLENMTVTEKKSATAYVRIAENKLDRSDLFLFQY